MTGKTFVACPACSALYERTGGQKDGRDAVASNSFLCTDCEYPIERWPERGSLSFKFVQHGFARHLTAGQSPSRQIR